MQFGLIDDRHRLEAYVTCKDRGVINCKLKIKHLFFRPTEAIAAATVATTVDKTILQNDRPR